MGLAKFTVLVTTLIISFISFSSEAQALMERPVIGILSQPVKKQSNENTNTNDTINDQYIAASYVKWVESGGASSIPIPYDADETLIREIFSQINGILLPGGGVELPSSVKSIWKLALESNQNGEFFPVWGTCLGFEFLVALNDGGDEEHTMQTGFKSQNISFPLIFPSEEDVIDSKGVYSVQSQLYPTQEWRETLMSHNITMNNHHKGITPEHFLKNQALSSFFHITSTNIDLEGKPFVSTIESSLYPIYGVQYHPEKNNFEYGLQAHNSAAFEAISHTQEAVALSMHLALFFVNKVRESTIGEYTLIDRHPAIYTYPVVKSVYFEQVYLIPPAEHWGSSTSTATSSSGDGLYKPSQLRKRIATSR